MSWVSGKENIKMAVFKNFKDEKFDEKYKQAITDNMDGFITVLDIHD